MKERYPLISSFFTDQVIHLQVPACAVCSSALQLTAKASSSIVSLSKGSCARGESSDGTIQGCAKRCFSCISSGGCAKGCFSCISSCASGSDAQDPDVFPTRLKTKSYVFWQGCHRTIATTFFALCTRQDGVLRAGPAGLTERRENRKVVTHPRDKKLKCQDCKTKKREFCTVMF